MILTCPECQARYVVDPAKIPPHGRKVRCARCRHDWTHVPPPPRPAEDLAHARDLPLEPIPEAVKPIPEGSNLPAPRRHRDDDRRGGQLWAAALLLAALALAGGLLRGPVVALWPASARLYAAIGLDVPPPGAELEFRDITARIEGGELNIAGRLVNGAAGPRQVLPIRLVVSDGAVELARIPVALSPGRLAAGEAVEFDWTGPAPEGAAELRLELAAP